MEAPNSIETVKKALRAYTTVDPLDEEKRGVFVDIAAWNLNGGHNRGPWGRKSRGRPGSDGMPVNPNTDGLTFLRSDGDFEIYDVIAGGDPDPSNPDRGKFATWGENGPFGQGENGFWAKCYAPPAARPEDPGVFNGILRDPRKYFFFLINRVEGSNADDWESVLKDLQNRGMSINPASGQRPSCEDKFHAIKLMVADNGNGPARGRIWLPTEEGVQDGNGNTWFTREVQVIKRVSSTSHVWDWHEIGGAQFVALVCGDNAGGGDGGDGGDGGNGGGEDEMKPEDVQRMIDEALRPYIKKGDKINLATQPWDGKPGQQVCGDRNAGNHLIANREVGAVGTWEELTIDRND